MSSLAREIEALLFLSGDPLPLLTLCELTGDSPGDVQRALADIAAKHDAGGGLEVVEIAGGHVLRTRADLAEICDRLRARPPDDKLSPAALETLAVVAYLEPISRPEVGRLRGVSVDSTMSSLVERGLLEEAGRAPDGGAMRFRTTRAFQQRFGLRDAGDLPSLETFELTGPEADAVRRRLAEGGLLATADDG